MTTRKLSSEREEIPSKRQRVEDDECGAADASFDSLPSDCKVNVFSFLPVTDLNTVVICSKGCCEARNNESLDQKRTGTIVLTESSTPESLNNVVVAAERKNIFSGNCTHLKIDGVDRLGLQGNTLLELPKLTGVTKLQISQTSSEADLVTRDCLATLIEMCPNATDIDLNGVKISDPEDLFHLMAEVRVQSIQQLAWDGCTFEYSFTCVFLRKVSNLTELYLDGAVFDTGNFSINLSMVWYGSMEQQPQFYLLQSCPILEKVSIKGATIRYEDDRHEELLPQEFIIKFVRLHPNLRWLRSDLSAENVAMLQAERPHITFVSD